MKRQSSLADLNEARALRQALILPIAFTAAVCIVIFKVFA